jgi:hypothetical protein
MQNLEVIDAASPDDEVSRQIIIERAKERGVTMETHLIARFRGCWCLIVRDQEQVI